jgi:protein BUR2
MEDIRPADFGSAKHFVHIDLSILDQKHVTNRGEHLRGMMTSAENGRHYPNGLHSRSNFHSQVTADQNGNDYWSGIIDVPTSSWLFDLDAFEENSPSRAKGIRYQDEITKRVKGVAFIFNACKQLRLSRSVGLTAAVIFHRFYMCDDMASHHYFEVGAASIFIACKADECRRNLKDVVKVCARIASGKTDVIDEESKMYWRWKDIIVNTEELMLQKLNFDVSPLNQYKVTTGVLKINLEQPDAVTVNKIWDEQAKQVFGNCTFFFEMFSRIPLSLFYSTECICAMVLILASPKFKVSYPEGFIETEFGVHIEDIIQCYDAAMSLSMEVETLDKYFRIIPFIPRITHQAIRDIYRGTPESSMRPEN